ncbi:MAG: hypothetical protein L6Q37_02090 [Bdellovibrionaceae bacterium]|nr:hypothetical protein [Pseudobdellovibrionaceae bacterium]NUM58453.1 hypothetical protein [Pseudobdellovibrionaceae bacterium]
MEQNKKTRKALMSIMLTVVSLSLAVSTQQVNSAELKASCRRYYQGSKGLNSPFEIMESNGIHRSNLRISIVRNFQFVNDSSYYLYLVADGKPVGRINMLYTFGTWEAIAGTTTSAKNKGFEILLYTFASYLLSKETSKPLYSNFEIRTNLNERELIDWKKMADAGWAIQDFSVRTKSGSTPFPYRITESFLKEMEDQFEDFLSHQSSGTKDIKLFEMDNWWDQ